MKKLKNYILVLKNNDNYLLKLNLKEMLFKQEFQTNKYLNFYSKQPFQIRIEKIKT